MSMSEWAKKEVELACKLERGDTPEDEWNYGCACYESALKAFEILCKEIHPGMSIIITKQILNRLIDGKVLTPIEDTNDIWHLCRSNYEWPKMYQCKRMSSLFKYVYMDGRIEYQDTEYAIGIDAHDLDISYHSSLISNIIHEMFPIMMSYVPTDNPYKVYTEECEVYDSGEKENLSVVGLLYAILPFVYNNEHYRGRRK